MNRYFVLLSTLPWVAITTGAFAADDTLDEIVVTAQRRAERLQDVPAAITALNGDSLNEMHLQGNADLAQRVPGLSFDVLGPGESTLSIRGLGTAYGLAPAVSYYLNETPLDIRTDGNAGAPDIDFFDVDRIEVLRGPQGTLYGSSAMGGALRILTAQPNPAALAVNAEVGGSYMDRGGAGYSAKSAINLPLSGDAAIRLVGTYEHVPGYINRVLPGDYGASPPQVSSSVARRINDVDIKGGRIIGTWKPTDALTITPSLVFSRIDAANRSETFSNLPDFTIAEYIATPLTSRLTVGNLAVTYDAGFASILSSSSVISRGVDALRDFTLFWANLAPPFGLTYPPNRQGSDLTTSRNSGFVQELRLTSPTDRRLRWVAGVYFSHFRQHSTETINSADFAAEIGQTDSSTLYTFDQAVIDQQAAVFADFTYKILPQLELTVGERYYELRDSLENVQADVLAPPSQPLVHAKASGNSPRFVLTYRPIGDATLYATAARGYRPGGPNVGLPAGVGCTLNDAYRPLYDPDSVWNYEIGAKTELWQRRVSVDVAAYRIDWKNVQQAITDPGCGSLFVANAGTAQSKGVEAEINVRPIDALRMWFSGSYTRATYQSIAAAFQDASAVHPGDAVPDVPRRKLNVGGEYTRSLGNYSSFLRLDWSHQGSVPTGFTYNDVRPAYSNLDAAIGVRGARYEASLYGHNLTNSVGILSIAQSTADSYGSVFNSRISTPPRTIGIDLKLHF